MLSKCRSIAILSLFAVWQCGLPNRCAAFEARQTDDDHFTKQIAPLFSTHCVTCHNSAEQAGGFSLETAEGFLDAGIVIAGDVEGSRLIEVVTTQNDDEPEMPLDALPLSAAEVEDLKAWIAAGARWPTGARISLPIVRDFDWWSLQPIQEHPVPAVADDQDTARIRNEIDAFVHERLNAAGLSFSPEADRRTLIRRLTFDLTGLPPTPDEIRDFEEDPAPDAYEKVVDRLLASPRYGEQWGRHWLDVSRYADTCGYDKDKPRPNAWPFRDYVIRSFNEDKPYDRFVREQIAGDVLYPDSPDGILGLGFLAAGPWDFIGHVEVPESKLDGKEARNLDRDEMVSATMNVFCSTTVQCARCHHHKFDPITQENYYGMQAIFAAVDRADRMYDLDPNVEMKRAAWEAERESIRQDEEALVEAFASKGGQTWKALKQEFQDAKRMVRPQLLDPRYGYHSQLVSNPFAEKWIELSWETEQFLSRIELYPCFDEFAGIGAGFGFPRSWKLLAADADGDWSVVAESDASLPAIFNPQVVEINEPVKCGRLRLVVTELAQRDTLFHVAIAEIRVFDCEENEVAGRAKATASDSIEAPDRWSIENLTDGRWPIYADTDRSARERCLEAAQKLWNLENHLRTVDHRIRVESIAERRATVEEKLAELPDGKLVYAAATHFKSEGSFRATEGQPRDVRVLQRGNIAAPGPPAVAGAIPLSPDDGGPFDMGGSDGEGARRAALADWIVDRQHPLTWRSIVNRIWLYHFGRGIVDTPSDFGRMGQTPSHLELLDWLADRFREQPSMKRLHRMIVTSTTYRQSSASRAEGESIDADNRMLWRMNRRRLEAEEIRDSILQVSGAMNFSMGGPGYYLFELQKPEHSPHYEYHLFDPGDEQTHRRSVYRFMVRSQPDPLMTTLDCADASQSVPRRDETLTALQALSLLNNRFVLVMAEHMSLRLEQESSKAAQRIQLAFERVTGRPPVDEEMREMELFAETHGLHQLCRMLFNLNEFIFID